MFQCCYFFYLYEYIRIGEGKRNVDINSEESATGYFSSVLSFSLSSSSTILCFYKPWIFTNLL